VQKEDHGPVAGAFVEEGYFEEGCFYGEHAFDGPIFVPGRRGIFAYYEQTIV
jgi:hypothetical protein